MFNISQNLLNISQNINKDNFDHKKKDIQELILKISNIEIDLKELEITDNTIKIKTTGVKRMGILLFVDKIRTSMREADSLSNTTLVL